MNAKTKLHIVCVTHHEIRKCACGQFLSNKSESVFMD